MRSDINIPKVEDISLAVIQEKDTITPVWKVYLINLKKIKINDVLVTSKGYGTSKGKNVKTSVLRHFLDEIPAQSFKLIEPIQENLFGISNEYWISFYVDKIIYDKKFIFLAESIKPSNFIDIPIIAAKGVMIG